MSEPDDDLINQPALANGSRNGHNLDVRRNMGQERFGVKFVDFLSTAATDHHGHLVDERIRYHCRHRLIGAVRRKFRAQMFIPHCVQLLFGSRQVRLP